MYNNINNIIQYIFIINSIIYIIQGWDKYIFNFSIKKKARKKFLLFEFMKLLDIDDYKM